MTRSRARAGIAIIFLGVFAACANRTTTTAGIGATPGADGGSADSATEGTFEMVRVCTQTACEAGGESADCSACWALAEVTMQQSGFSQAAVDHCNTVCSGSPCANSGNTQCARGYFTADITAATDNALYAACVAYFHLDDGDAQRTSDEAESEKQICAGWAKTQRPEMTAFYECRTANDNDASTCPAPSPTSLGDELCGGLTAAGGAPEADDYFACNSGHTGWNIAGGELRDDAVKAGLSCLANDCEALEDCLSAWQQAIERGR